MNEKQIQLVQNSWKIFRDINPQLVGAVFYERLFTESPELRMLFANNMEGQYVKLVEMLSIVIARLDRLDEVTEGIVELAKRHNAYGVKPAHYKLVGDALLWTLQQGFGRSWNEPLREAWLKCYTLLSDTMISAAEN